MKRVCVVDLWTGQRLAGLWQTGWRVGGWQVAGGWRAGDRRVAGGWLVVSWWVLVADGWPAAVRDWPCGGWGRQAGGASARQHVGPADGRGPNPGDPPPPYS